MTLSAKLWPAMLLALCLCKTTSPLHCEELPQEDKPVLPEKTAEQTKVQTADELMAPPELKGIHPLRLQIDDASCRVRLATVHLQINDLNLVDGSIVGEYTIRVPLMPSKDEVGILNLNLKDSPKGYFTKGGQLKGLGYPTNKEEPPRQIIANLSPSPQKKRNGAIQLSIDTGQRVLEFDSAYSVLSGWNALFSAQD
jgi:hypothetical protein